MHDERLTFEYEHEAHTGRLLERIHDCVESISLGFDGYGDDQTKGPGLYIAIVTGRSVEQFADAMGANRWPVESCRNVLEDIEEFHDAARTVANSCDGGVVVGVDGSILEQMVRFRHVDGEDLEPGMRLADIEYADWMGARHMSALELSSRPESVVTVTLSEQSGRVSTFQNGTYETTPREQLGGPWRAED